ncbi:MAG TPA: hypothetical protein VGN32_13505 [Ktedonobacterales bacterium]|nr:hypothetical protein [Ktedonobacterales bacterium]
MSQTSHEPGEPPADGGPRLSTDRVMAHLSGRGMFMALQLSVNLCAALLGLGVFLVLVNSWHVIALIAAVLGLGCAVLARKAIATGIVALLLLRVRRRAREQGDLPGH